jgi:acetyl-CoA carboxylase carboxyltransferase component
MATSVTPTSKPMDEQVAELRGRRRQVELGGGEQRIAKHHAAHKLTARKSSLISRPTS